LLDSVDIRAVLVKGRNSQWYSAFLKIYLTKESEDKVKKIHKMKETFRTITLDDNFNLISECKDLSELNSVFNGIQQGQIIINEIPINLVSAESKNIYNYNLSSNESVIDLYTTPEQRNGYAQKFICLGTNETPSEIINRFGISLTKQSGDIFVFLHPYLDTTSINSSNNNVVIIFPIYCKSLPLTYDENDRYYKKLTIHNYLLRAYSILLFQKEGKPVSVSVDNPKLINYVHKTAPSNEMINILLPKPDNLQELDKIRIQIVDDALALILSDEVILDKFSNIHTVASESIKELLKLPINQLCKKDESLYLEFKSSLRWDYESGKVSESVEYSAIKEIAAFMNSSGGILVIGIGDNGRILGLQKDFDTFKHKRNWDIWSQHLDNLIYCRYHINRKFSEYIHIKKETINSYSIAVIIVQPSPEPVWMKLNNVDTVFMRSHNVTPSLQGKPASEFISSHWHGI
jgi:Putative DNA-binding domain